MVNWQDDEAVVRAAVPRLYMVQHNAAIWRSKEERNAWFHSGQPQPVIHPGYLGPTFAKARQHPTVQAWEKAHRPAEAERPKAYPFSSSRTYYFCDDADAYMDQLEAERDALRAEVEQLKLKLVAVEAENEELGDALEAKLEPFLGPTLELVQQMKLKK